MKNKSISHAILEEIESYCDDPNAKTIPEIRVALREAGKPSSEKVVIKWLRVQIELGKVRRVRVKRQNSNGVFYPTVGYLLVG